VAALPDLEAEKEAAARSAVANVRPGMRVALGTGSTAAHAVRLLAAQPQLAGAITTVASSVATERLARELKLSIRPLSPHDVFDVMIDGADEVTPRLDLTKGGGGALFREKLLARLSREVLIIVDHTKCVERLGSRVPIPIEVVPFARGVFMTWLADRGLPAEPRMVAGQIVRTDNGNEVLDVRPTHPVSDAAATDREIRELPGVVETGIFIGLADRVYVGRTDGEVDTLIAPEPRAARPSLRRSGRD
jgi:ribose 5-phosphate isomerase A